MKEPVLVELSDVLQAKFCPLCGDPWVEVYLGDYHGYIRCYNDGCERDIDFMIQRELRERGLRE